jgi:hypothetical protein
VLWNFAKPGAFFARNAGTVVLAVGALSLFALALGIAAMSSRHTSQQTREADIEPAPEIAAISVPVAELAQEAEVEARSVMASAVLFQVNYKSGSGLYTFLFTEPTPMHELQIIGPHNEPGKPRWEVRGAAAGFPNLERMILWPLDLTGLMWEPADIAEVVARQSGIPTAAVDVVLSSRDSVPHQWGVARGLRGMNCDLPDGADISQIRCPQPGPVGGPPAVASP